MGLVVGQNVQGTVQGLYDRIVRGAYCCPASGAGWHILFVPGEKGRPMKMVAYNVSALEGKPASNLVKAAKRWAEKVRVGRERFLSKKTESCSYLHEYRRMTGIGPSLMEKAAADPMLDVLAKAFSVKDVTPADVKFIRYRKVGKGIELEDQAERLGGILTSVEPSDADPKALVAFLKKHGAKSMKAESLDEQVYSMLGPGPKAGAESDVAKFCADIERGVQSAVRGKFFRCRPNLKFGVGGANIDYANIPATEQPGSLAFLNAKVQVRLTVDGFDAEGNLKGSKIKVEKLTSPHGIKFRAKTGTVDQVVKHIVNTIKAAAAL